MQNNDEHPYPKAVIASSMAEIRAGIREIMATGGQAWMQTHDRTTGILVNHKRKRMQIGG